MAKITFEESNIFDKVEKIVCRYFGVELGNIVSKNTTNKVSMARNYMYYLLHCHFCISIRKISESYFRTERGVKHQISIMRVCIKSNSAFKEIFSKLVEML